MGFQPATIDDITYIPVIGYQPPTAVDLSQPGIEDKSQSKRTILLPEYTESLFDWISRVLTVSSSPRDLP
jgi:hypothetical protein